MRQREALYAWLFLLPNLLGFMAFTLLPVLASLVLAFSAWDLFSAPRFVGLENFHDLIGLQARPEQAFASIGFVAIGMIVFAVGLFLYRRTRKQPEGEVVSRGWWPVLSIVLGLIGFGVLSVCVLNAYEPRTPRFWYYLYNTAFLMLGLPVSIIGSLFLACLLNRRLFARNFFRLIFFLPSVVTGVGIYILWSWIFNPNFGLLNMFIWQVFGIEGPRWLESTAWAKPALVLMNIWGTMGGMGMVLYLAALQSVNPELYEAADLDGASPWHRFWHIIWPLVYPTTFFIAIMGVIAGFQGGFDAAYVMTQGGPAGSTTTLNYFIYETGFNFFYMGRASAASWIMFLIVMAFTLAMWWHGNKKVH